MLTVEQKKWATRLKKTLSEMPVGIEIVVGLDEITILPAGFYHSNIWDAGVDMMCDGGRIITEGALATIPIDTNRVKPNSESI